MLDAVDRRPGNNRSGWVRGALEMRLFVEDLEENADTPELPDDWWQEALEEYLSDREQQPASIEA